MKKGENKLTAASATAFLKAYEKEQSELCWKEMQEVLKKFNRKLDTAVSMDENEQVVKRIILVKA